MDNSEILTPTDVANRVSQVLLLITLGIGAIGSVSVLYTSSVLLEIFQSLNTELPMMTQFLISPFGKLTLPGILIALIAKEFLFKDQVMRRFTLNCAGLVLVIVAKELLAHASYSLLNQLNNL